MAGILPNRIDPARLAETGARISGRMRLDEMASVSAETHGHDGDAEIELQFGRDEENRACVTGRITATAEVICQRCMQPMPLVLSAQVSLGIVADEAQGQALPERYEPLLVGQGPMALADLVEQELLLAWPMTPRHPQGACHPALQPESGAPAEKPNPFAALESLRKDKT